MNQYTTKESCNIFINFKQSRKQYVFAPKPLDYQSTIRYLSKRSFKHNAMFLYWFILSSNHLTHLLPCLLKSAHILVTPLICYFRGVGNTWPTLYQNKYILGSYKTVVSSVPPSPGNTYLELSVTAPLGRPLSYSGQDQLMFGTTLTSLLSYY